MNQKPKLSKETRESLKDELDSWGIKLADVARQCGRHQNSVSKFFNIGTYSVRIHSTVLLMISEKHMGAAEKLLESNRRITTMLRHEVEVQP